MARESGGGLMSLIFSWLPSMPNAAVAGVVDAFFSSKANQGANDGVFTAFDTTVGQQRGWVVVVTAAMCFYLLASLIRGRAHCYPNPFKWKLFEAIWTAALAGLSVAGTVITFNDEVLRKSLTGFQQSELMNPTMKVAMFYIALKLLGYIDGLLLAAKKKLSMAHQWFLFFHVLFVWSCNWFDAAFLYQMAWAFLLSDGLMYTYRFVKTLPLSAQMLASFFLRVSLIGQVFSMLVTTIYCVNALQGTSETLSSLHWWIIQIGAVSHIVYIGITCKTYLKCFHPNMRDSMTVFLLIMHICGVVGVVKLWQMGRWKPVIECYLVYVFSGLGITVGAHRLWAHRAFSASLPFRAMLMVMASFANQGTIYSWIRDHRVHHQHSEMEADPHDATRGFFFSHCGWLLLKKNEACVAAGKMIDCSDVLEDSVVRFQLRWNPYWNQIICFLLPSLYTAYVYNSFWFGFFAHGALRWILTLHATWTVNSVAHLWGDRPYRPNINPAESVFTAIVAVGEGWHNWHHAYPFDYAASEGGIYSHWNPSKVVIDTAAFFGHAWGRRRATAIWEAEKEKHRLHMEAAAAGLAKRTSQPELFMLPSLSSSLPPHCTKKSLIRSTLSLVEDFLICSMIAGMAILIMKSRVGQFCAETYFINQAVNVLLWTTYALAQGTVGFGVWVLGYEASGGRFSDYQWLNHLIGLVLHSALMIPYHPRRANRERKRASLMRCLYEDAFAILKIPSWNVWVTGAAAALSVGVLCLVLGCKYGWLQLFCWYGGPWIVLNLWMTVYHWLLENGPQDNECDVDISSGTLEYFTHEWLQDMWPKATRERKYPWTRFVDHLHHHLSLSHVVQAVDFNVPHYHVKEAFRRLGEILEEFSEIVDAKSTLCNAGIKVTHGPSTIGSVSSRSGAGVASSRSGNGNGNGNGVSSS